MECESGGARRQCGRNGHTARENLHSCEYVEEEEEFHCAACGGGSRASLRRLLSDVENHSRVQFSGSRKAHNEHLSNCYFLVGPSDFCSECSKEGDFPCPVCCPDHDDPMEDLELEGVTAGLHARSTRSSNGKVQFQCDHRSEGGMQELFFKKGLVDPLKQSTRRHKQYYRCETVFRSETFKEEEEEVEEGDHDDVYCYLCIEPFDSLLDKVWHEYDQHLTCSACFRIFASRRAFEAHISESNGHNFCFECNLNFPFREQLAQHRRCATHKTPHNCLPTMSDVGVKKKLYVCHNCHDYEGDDIFMKFATEQELQNHIDTMHSICHKCDKEFTSRQALSEHILHSYRHHFCRECEYDFPSKQAFDMHCRTGLHMD